jgi:WbqC-like protein family
MSVADEFIIYDSVQYTKNDWRNRNLLIGNNGPVWLTLPIKTSGKPYQRINEATISDSRWAKKHWSTITQILSRRPHFTRYREEWKNWYDAAHAMENLHDVNLLFLRGIANQLGIDTRIRDDREFSLRPDTPTGKLIQLCQQTGAERYVTGPAALAYLDSNRFCEAGISVEIIRYDAYPEYEQTNAAFEHGVSVLDLLASEGDRSAGHLIGTLRTLVSDGG